MNNKKKMKVGKKIAIVLLAVLVILIGILLIYVSDYYHADASAIEESLLGVELNITNTNGALVLDPGNAEIAFIFYPGGKVEYTAYEPLLIKIAKNGILCILPKMPFNLAVFKANAADSYRSNYPEITQWYIGGHSLGGSMAASYAAKNTEKITGLILLASYSAADISESDLRVMSIYGSQDTVLNPESYQNNKLNLPENFTELVLSGANHAGFGAYGPQKGDGVATITAEQQQLLTATAVVSFCLSENVEA
jgi:dienelactone hydrolase